FNSLTLSPALCAVLLKPREKGSYTALPRLAFLIAGGWLGWAFLGPVAVSAGLGLLPAQAESLRPALPWVARGVSAVLGVAAGWLAARLINFLLGGFFGLFNVAFERVGHVYTRLVGLSLRLSVLVLLVYGGMLGLTWWGFTETPKGFIPSQDMGYLLVNVQLPD